MVRFWYLNGLEKSMWSVFFGLIVRGVIIMLVFLLISFVMILFYFFSFVLLIFNENDGKYIKFCFEFYFFYLIIILSKVVSIYFNVVVGWIDKYIWMSKQIKKIDLFILVIIFDMNYKMVQIYIIYMYFINVIFIWVIFINLFICRWI